MDNLSVAFQYGTCKATKGNISLPGPVLGWREKSFRNRCGERIEEIVVHFATHQRTQKINNFSN